MRSATDEFILRELAEGGGWPYTGKAGQRPQLAGSTDSLKNRAAAVLANNGIAPYSDLFGPGGLRFLQQLELQPPRRQLDSMLTQHDPPHGTCAHPAGASECSGELVSRRWPLRPTRATDGRRLDPAPSAARRTGPPRAVEWITQTLPTHAPAVTEHGTPTTRGP